MPEVGDGAFLNNDVAEDRWHARLLLASFRTRVETWRILTPDPDMYLQDLEHISVDNDDIVGLRFADREVLPSASMPMTSTTSSCA